MRCPLPLFRIRRPWRPGSGNNLVVTSIPAAALVWLLFACFAATFAPAQDLQVVARADVSGTITELKSGEISIRNDEGEVLTCKIQDKGQRALSLGGTPTRFAATINARGSIPLELVEPGMIVTFSAKCNVYGKSTEPISRVRMLDGDASDQLNVEFLERPEKNSDMVPVEVIGRVVNFKGGKLQLQVPKAKWAKKERILFEATDDATLEVADQSLRRVVPGDRVDDARLFQFNSGEWAVREISIALVGPRETLTRSFDDQLNQKFSHLPDDPAEPRELRSPHFILFTDLSERSANILLAKLETMHDLVSGYFRARPRQPIQCYVVRDIRQWPADRLDPTAIGKILEPAGVTISRRIGRDTTAIVYSCAKHSVVQHEAVHAFCLQTFGATGPTWYSEGMAEMGHYWKPDNLAVSIDPVVITYLTTNPAPSMAQIVAPGQRTGDSWQAYAWRWALCHLLASNPNYSRRFKTLGMNLMSQGRDDSFDSAFGKVADQISFEYDQFIEHFGNGYRVDLCAWDWKTKATNLTSNGRMKEEIEAQSGWQATRLLVRPGVSYDYVAQGEWTVDPATTVDAAGAADGRGRLVAAIFADYQLGEPFELGPRGTFVAPTEGQLMVRCRDGWTSLADNEGELTLHLRRTPKEDSSDAAGQ